MQDLEEIRTRLTDQDKALADNLDILKDLLRTIKGSVSMGLEGLMPGMERMEKTIDKMEKSMNQMLSDIAHLQRWKQRLQSGQISLNIPTAVNTFFRFLGWIVATAIAIWAISNK